MTTESKNTDQTTGTNQALSRAYVRGHECARALTFSYGTTAVTRDKMFRERQISICLNKTPRKPYVNTRPRAGANARASRDPASAGAEALSVQI
jgi:hypothetical protein